MNGILSNTVEKCLQSFKILWLVIFLPASLTHVGIYHITTPMFPLPSVVTISLRYKDFTGLTNFFFLFFFFLLFGIGAMESGAETHPAGASGNR